MKLMKNLLALAFVAALGLAGAIWWWLQAALPLRAERVEVSIEAGASPRDVARLWAEAGVDVPPEWLYQWFRWSGQSRKIRAGSYEIEQGVSPKQLLDKMVRGEQVLELLRVIDGWSMRQVRDAVARAPGLRNTLKDMTDAQAAAALGRPDDQIEGWLFPDSYAYSRGVSDITVLKRAHAAMQQRVADAWAQRTPDSPLKSPAELLTLASVVEKETGQAGDRGLIAGVFSNRLRIGMPLQSDPTVIYGLGASFDGNLRKADLLADTPWNTYTRRGLPPTPIAMPGARALLAAAKPDKTDALYFVAKGDGSSAFSSNLSDHNRAVNQFQRGSGR